jgi:hypothetical protein
MGYLQAGVASLRRIRWGGREWMLPIVLLAFVLRVYRLGAQAIWWDESLSLYRATQNLGTILGNTILIQNVVTHDTQPPLYFAVLHAFVVTLGTGEYALRFASTAADVATIPLLYVLARRWFGAPVALTAAFLGALSPFYVWYAQEARPYALVLLFSLLGVYALARALGGGRPAHMDGANSPADTRITVSWLWASVYIFATAATLYANYYAVFMIPFHAALIALVTWRTPRARPLVLLPALPTASAVFVLPVLRAAAVENAAGGPSYVPMDVILRDLLNSFTVGTTVDLAQVWWIDAALLIVFLIGLAAFRRSALYLVAYLAAPLLGLAAASMVRPLYQNSRYFISLSPAYYLGVAAGIVGLGQRWRLAAVPAVGVFLVGAVLSLDNWYFNPSYGKDDHRAWAEYLRQDARSGDFLILDSPHTQALYRYYADDTLPMTTLPIIRLDHVASPAADLSAVRNALAQNSRVWLLQMDVPFDDPDARIQKLLGENGVLLDETPFHGTSTAISLSLYAASMPAAQETEIEHPMDVAFAGHLHLRGYASPSSVQNGKPNSVKLYWQIDEPVGEDYAVSLRVVDASGKTKGQQDAVPLGNRAGSSTWKPGLIVVDEMKLPVAPGMPPGAYTLQVVPYHPATGAALGDVVTLGVIQVVATMPAAKGPSSLRSATAP